MITNDSTTSSITRRIFREVAKLAWNGELEAKKDFLPEEIIPGPTPQFRCCMPGASAREKTTPGTSCR